MHRGWSVLAAAAIGVFMTIPGQTVGVAPFVDLLARDLSLPREHVILLYSLGTLLGILFAPLIGRLLDRYGPRRMIVFVAVRSARVAPSWPRLSIRGRLRSASRCCAAARSAA